MEETKSSGGTPLGESKTALIAGASGLIGRSLLDLLLASDRYEKVTALVRRKLLIADPKLVELKADFEKPETLSHLIHANDVFCCLGTTIKKAGSREAFENVDFGYPQRLARVTVDNHAEQFCIVTAVGANPKSTVFYNRVKGKVEQVICSLPFRAVHIMRPSILLGERDEFRMGEKLGMGMMNLLSPLMVGKFRKYRPIQAFHVAEAMLLAANSGKQGCQIYESDVIQAML